MAMLSTHLLSKKHRARAHQQAGSSSITTPTSLLKADGTVNDEHQRNTKSPVKEGELGEGDLTLEHSEADHAEDSLSTQSVGDPTGVVGGSTAPDESQCAARTSAKKRRRKAERDRKKARARLQVVRLTDDDGLKLSDLSALTDTGSLPEQRVIDVDSTSTLSNGEQEHRTTSPHTNSDEPRSVLPPDDQRTAEVQKNVPVLEPDTSVETTSMDTPPTTHIVEATLNVQPRTRWHCSVCGSTWRQKKSWQGHLSSAQHSRHVLRTMQSINPVIPPYGRKSVVASMDPFGWGAGAGVVEEESDDE